MTEATGGWPAGRAPRSRSSSKSQLVRLDAVVRTYSPPIRTWMLCSSAHTWARRPACSAASRSRWTLGRTLSTPLREAFHRELGELADQFGDLVLRTCIAAGPHRGRAAGQLATSAPTSSQPPLPGDAWSSSASATGPHTRSAHRTCSASAAPASLCTTPTSRQSSPPAPSPSRPSATPPRRASACTTKAASPPGHPRPVRPHGTSRPVLSQPRNRQAPKRAHPHDRGPFGGRDGVRSRRRRCRSRGCAPTCSGSSVQRSRGRRRRHRARLPATVRRTLGDGDSGAHDAGRGRARRTAALLSGPAPAHRLSHGVN
jgi:hypothetical protein